MIRLRGLGFAYPGRAPVLRDLDFRLEQREKVGVVGDNGSGKTTLLHLIMGLLPPTAGELELFGKPVTGREEWRAARLRIGLLFQDSDDQLFSPTVLEDVAFGPLNQGRPPEEAEAIARRTLAELGIAGLAERITYQLSGGEKKLVAVATILAMSPQALLLDEPTSGLDEGTRERLIAILEGRDLAMMVISHDYDFLARVTGRLYLMADGHLKPGLEEAIHSHFHVHRLGNQPHRHDP